MPHTRNPSFPVNRENRKQFNAIDDYIKLYEPNAKSKETMFESNSRRNALLWRRNNTRNF